MANCAGGIDSHEKGRDCEACPAGSRETSVIPGILRTLDSGNICVLHKCRPGHVALLDLKDLRSDAGDLAVQPHAGVLAHVNPMANADFQDARTHGFRGRVPRLRRRCCWGEDGKDRDDGNPTKWLLVEKICRFHSHGC